MKMRTEGMIVKIIVLIHQITPLFKLSVSMIVCDDTPNYCIHKVAIIHACICNVVAI